MRVYELAKEYNKVSTGFLDEIQGYGIEVKSHLASLTDDQIAIIRQRRADTEKPEVKEFLPPPDVVEPPKEEKSLEELASDALNESAEKTQELQEQSKKSAERFREEEEIEKRADEVSEKLQEIKQRQWAEIDRPKGFFGWLFSFFS